MPATHPQHHDGNRRVDKTPKANPPIAMPSATAPVRDGLISRSIHLCRKRSVPMRMKNSSFLSTTPCASRRSSSPGLLDVGRFCFFICSTLPAGGSLAAEAAPWSVHDRTYRNPFLSCRYAPGDRSLPPPVTPHMEDITNARIGQRNHGRMCRDGDGVGGQKKEGG